MFADALPITLKFEGGFADNPKDPGGRTNFGITQNTYDPTGKKDVKDITPTEVHDIYQNDFWLPSKSDQIDFRNQLLATLHFDTAVNTGIRQAAIILQRALNVTTDGIIGPATLNAITGGNDICFKQLHEREEFYRNLVDANPQKYGMWLDNWLNRVERLRAIVNGN